MPELAEVQTLAGQLHDTLAGHAITSARSLHPPFLAPDDTALMVGAKIGGVDRWGKRLRFRFADGRVLIVGLGMTGGFTLRPISAPLSHHTRLTLTIENEIGCDYTDPRKFGRALLFSDDTQAEATLDGRIGRDAAGPLRWQDLRDALTRGTGRTALKAALLDQRRLAGLGNYLADEICGRAGVLPQRPAGRVTSREWILLNRARMTVITEALRHQGLSFSDYRHTDGGKGSMSGALRFYGRAGQPCFTCATILTKTTVAGRGTVICPTCQT